MDLSALIPWDYQPLVSDKYLYFLSLASERDDTQDEDYYKIEIVNLNNKTGQLLAKYPIKESVFDQLTNQ